MSRHDTQLTAGERDEIARVLTQGHSARRRQAPGPGSLDHHPPDPPGRRRMSNVSDAYN